MIEVGHIQCKSEGDGTADWMLSGYDPDVIQISVGITQNERTSQNRRISYVHRPRYGEVSHPLMLFRLSATVTESVPVRTLHPTESVALFPITCPETVLQDS